MQRVAINRFQRLKFQLVRRNPARKFVSVRVAAGADEGGSIRGIAVRLVEADALPDSHVTQTISCTVMHVCSRQEAGGC
jgi:hypothetical protein